MQGLSMGDSNAQQAASAGVSYEGPAAAAGRAGDQVHFEEVAGPINSLMKCRCAGGGVALGVKTGRGG